MSAARQRKEPRGRQVLAASYLGCAATKPITTPDAAAFRKVVTFWLPRQFLAPSGVHLRAFIEDVNQKISQRGFVLSDGQVLTTPITDVIEGGLVEPDLAALDGHILFQGCMRIGQYTEVIVERAAQDARFEVPVVRDWGQPQRDFFGPQNPYQMAEDAADYTWSHVMTCVDEPYLSATERIVAIVHGKKDSHYFYCPCNSADVVYTTRQRLVCMGCGATHLVLRDALSIRPARLLTAEEWLTFFDDSGSRRDDELELSIVDFCDIENASAIWSTEQWERAKHEFIFFARSSPEEIANAIRGTERDPSILLEAGWTRVDTPPPPAHQVSAHSVDVDLVENAGHALRQGVRSYLEARHNPDQLVNAIPQLFRAIELLLKARLQDLDAGALTDHPNNPTVLKRLGAKQVDLHREELDTITRLRRLRNDLQHGRAQFNYRTGLYISRRAIVLVDRFVRAELGLWMGEAIAADDWYQLLSITEVAGTANEVLESSLKEIRKLPDATITLCERCGKHALVRQDPRTGASCFYCGHVTALRDRAP